MKADDLSLEQKFAMTIVGVVVAAIVVVVGLGAYAIFHNDRAVNPGHHRLHRVDPVIQACFDQGYDTAEQTDKYILCTKDRGLQP